MLSAIHTQLQRSATWPVLGRLLAAFLLCQLGFLVLWWQFGLPTDVPDLQFGYQPRELSDRFDAWGEDHRRVYVATALTLDIAVPILYGTLFAGSTVRLLGDLNSPWVIAPALAASAADLAENAVLASLAWTHDGRESALAWVACACTLAKFLAAAVAIGLLLFAAITRFRRAKSESQR